MPKQPKTNPQKKPSTTPPTGSRRDELAAQTARDTRDRQIRRRVGLILAATATAVLVFTGIWLATTGPASPAATTATSGPTASGKDTWTIGVGQVDAPVRVDVYQDFMCPYCQRFEQANGPGLKQLVDAGTIRLEIHPMSFLDRTSQGARYSTRAANAFVTVAQVDPDRILAFNRALYDNQPAEGTTGLTDAQLATLAQDVGVAPSVTDTFPQLSHEQWVADGTQADFASGVTGTPTVLFDGKPFTGDLLTAAALRSAIETAAND